tara:strand:- start:3602 stop:3877 length:276 start_codon:yes stop_codon:yes gene_type:complete
VKVTTKNYSVLRGAFLFGYRFYKEFDMSRRKEISDTAREEIASLAFRFVDHYVIFRESDGQYILNGHPDNMEITLRRLLTEQREKHDTETE